MDWIKQHKTALVLGGVFLIRLLPVLAVHYTLDSGFVDTGHKDPLFYLGGARAIISTGTNPFNFCPPFYFCFVTAALWLSGGSPIVAVAANAFVGWLVIVEIYLLGKLLFDKRTALTAALIAGLYPNLIFFGTVLFPETLAMFFVLAAFIMIARFFSSSRLRFLVMAGVLWAFASQTRGGLHYFSVFALAALACGCFSREWQRWVRAAAAFIIPLYVTFFLITFGTASFHESGNINSISGLGSVLHGLNRISCPNTDDGDIGGNLFYDVNACGDMWPAGSQIYSEDLIKSGTVAVLLATVRFVAQEPWTHLKQALWKLSSFWTPSQYSISFFKHKFFYKSLALTICGSVTIGFVYVLVLCGGIIGLSLSKDPLRATVLFFVLFYCLLIMATVGNSKLRLLLMPFFILYCSYALTQFRSKLVSLKKLVKHTIAMTLLVFFLLNSIYRYNEVSVTPQEAFVRKVERCVSLHLYKTALYVINKDNMWQWLTEKQRFRLQTALKIAKKKLSPGT